MSGPPLSPIKEFISVRKSPFTVINSFHDFCDTEELFLNILLIQSFLLATHGNSKLVSKNTDFGGSQ